MYGTYTSQRNTLRWSQMRVPPVWFHHTGELRPYGNQAVAAYDMLAVSYADGKSTPFNTINSERLGSKGGYTPNRVLVSTTNRNVGVSEILATRFHMLIRPDPPMVCNRRQNGERLSNMKCLTHLKHYVCLRSA